MKKNHKVCNDNEIQKIISNRKHETPHLLFADAIILYVTYQKIQ